MAIELLILQETTVTVLLEAVLEAWLCSRDYRRCDHSDSSSKA